MDSARPFRVISGRWFSLSHQRCALFPQPYLLLSARSGKVRKSHLPDLSFQFSADFRAGTSRLLGRRMVVAKTTIVDCSGVVALVAARTNGRCLFLRLGRENCARLAAG